MTENKSLITRSQSTQALSPQQNAILSALVIAGTESILKGVADGSLSNWGGIERIRQLLNDYDRRHESRASAEYLH